jgi:hypothetical protein
MTILFSYFFLLVFLGFAIGLPEKELLRDLRGRQAASANVTDSLTMSLYYSDSILSTGRVSSFFTKYASKICANYLW